MPISVGDRIPEAPLTAVTAAGPIQTTSREIFDGKKVVLFSVPGAFTPTCNNQHLPGYLAQHDALTVAVEIARRTAPGTAPSDAAVLAAIAEADRLVLHLAAPDALARGLDAWAAHHLEPHP